MKYKYTFQLILISLTLSIQNALITTDSIPDNVALVRDFTPSQNVLNNIQFLLNPSEAPKSKNEQIAGDTKEFIKKITNVVNDFLKAIQSHEYTTYLKQRDQVRAKKGSAQDTAAGFLNAYTNNSTIVDEVNRHYQKIVIGLQAILNYETLVGSIGDNSEISLRDRLVPLVQIILKLVQ